MAAAQAEALPGGNSQSVAQLHSSLRFASGTTAAFVVSEAMGWYPTFLAPLLAGVLIASLPGALPVSAGVMLFLVMSLGAYAAFILSSLLHSTPVIQFGAIALILFVCFATLARGRGFLPILLVLISFATIPIVTMLTPQQAGALPLAFSRGMAVAVAAVWVTWAIWPAQVSAASAGEKQIHASPLAMAITGLAIVLPLMLLYLMFAITDALPVLITTVVLVINFDPKRSAMQGLAMMVGNFVGGVVAVVAYGLLQIAPNLAGLALITFMVASLFAIQIGRGGPAGSVGLITFNQAMVMFSLALVPGGSSPSLWMTRLFQFAVACIFAIGMMSLLFPRLQRRV